MSVPSGYAQTNIQLFRQLQRQSYTSEDRQQVFEAYELAMRIFSGLYQPSGKPFIDHLVGTASILASLRLPVEIVAAGLIHAAYLHGDFGPRRAGITQTNRQRVRQAVGAEIESYVAGYHRFAWNSQTITSVHDGLATLGPVDRNLTVMRLANQLEHHLDLGALYFARNEMERRRHQNSLERLGPLCIAIAERVGYKSLAADLQEAFTCVTLAEYPKSRLNFRSQKEAYLITPLSYRLRVWVSFYRLPLERSLKGAKRQYARLRRLIDERLRKPLQRLDTK